MSAQDPELAALFIASYNADLADLHSAARVASPAQPGHEDMIELLDDEGQFVTFIPDSTEPRMAVIAYNLYGQGLNRGVRAGELAAWAKLRFLIGAAAVDHGHDEHRSS